MIDRLPIRVQKKITIQSNGCWLWTGAKTSTGYGHLAVGSRTDGSRRYVKAHRFVYEALRGPIDSEVLDHLCRTPLCVNPWHLDAVTNRTNVARGVGHGHERNCPNGHPYSPDNTYVNRGKRFCRTCRRDRNAEIEARRKPRVAAGGGK